jgi:hypothetical protein
MPVILTAPEPFEPWIRAPWEGARTLQRRLADDALIVLPPKEVEAATQAQ